jgi:hypothetical protein
MNNQLSVVSKEIARRLIATQDFPLPDRNRSWFDQAVGSIALIAGDEEIVYIDHSINATDDTAAAIVAFTANVMIVIDVEYDDAYESGKVLSTHVHGRTELSGFSIERISGAFRDESDTSPRRLSLTLEYGDRTFALPYSQTDPYKAAELAAIVPALARDLNA